MQFQEFYIVFFNCSNWSRCDWFGGRYFGDIDDPESEVLTVTENGQGKRTKLSEYTKQIRGGKGRINYKITAKTGDVVGMTVVNPKDELYINFLNEAKNDKQNLNPYFIDLAHIITRLRIKITHIDLKANPMKSK